MHDRMLPECEDEVVLVMIQFDKLASEVFAEAIDDNDQAHNALMVWIHTGDIADDVQAYCREMLRGLYTEMHR